MSTTKRKTKNTFSFSPKNLRASFMAVTIIPPVPSSAPLYTVVVVVVG
jgi:hypothetical protein